MLSRRYEKVSWNHYRYGNRCTSVRQTDPLIHQNIQPIYKASISSPLEQIYCLLPDHTPCLPLLSTRCRNALAYASVDTKYLLWCFPESVRDLDGIRPLGSYVPFISWYYSLIQCLDYIGHELWMLNRCEAYIQRTLLPKQIYPLPFHPPLTILDNLHVKVENDSC